MSQTCLGFVYILCILWQFEANMTHLGVRIFNRVDHELADEFINDKGLFMKYTSDMRKAGYCWVLLGEAVEWLL